MSCVAVDSQEQRVWKSELWLRRNKGREISYVVRTCFHLGAWLVLVHPTLPIRARQLAIVCAVYSEIQIWKYIHIFTVISVHFKHWLILIYLTFCVGILFHSCWLEVILFPPPSVQSRPSFLFLYLHTAYSGGRERSTFFSFFCHIQTS